MDLIREGQKITLFFPKKEKMVEMICSVEKVYNDRLDLVLPQYFMRYIEFLQVGSRLTAKVFSKLGTIDFNTVVISSPLEDTFTVELDLNSVKLTSGEELPVINSLEILEVAQNDNYNTVKTFEISNEYVKFYSDKKFKIGDLLDCSLFLPKDYGIITFKGQIAEIDTVYDNEYKLDFITVTETARQTLLYYMYMYSTNSD